MPAAEGSPWPILLQKSVGSTLSTGKLGWRSLIDCPAWAAASLVLRLDATNATDRYLRNAWAGRIGWVERQLGEATKILGDCCKRKFELRAGWSTQS